MVALIANDKKITCPTCWEDCTTENYQDIHKLEPDANNIHVFSALTKTDYAGISESESEDLDAAIYQHTAFVANQEQKFKKMQVPKGIKVNGQFVLLPQKISRLTIIQNFCIRQEMVKAKKLDTLISITCAVFLQPIIDGTKFDMDRAREIEKEILKMNIYDTYPIGFFFLSKLNNYGNFGLLNWLRNLPKRMKRELLLLKLRMSLSLILFTICLSSTAIAKPTDNCRASSCTSHSTTLCRSFCYGKSGMSIKTDLSQHVNYC